MSTHILIAKQDFTIVVIILSLLTTAILVWIALWPSTSRGWIVLLLIWQWILVVLWAAVAGVTGDSAMKTRNGLLQTAFAFTLIELVAWMIGGTMGSIGMCCTAKRSKKDGVFG